MELGLQSIPFSCLPLVVQTKRRELGGMGVEFKALPCEMKVDKAKRRYEGQFASYGNVDKGNDLIEPFAGGSYLKSRWDNYLIKTFWDHEIPCGPRPDVLEETKDGLFAAGTITNHPSFDLLLAQLEDGTIRHGSIGWINRGSEIKSIDGKAVRVVKAYEPVKVSPCYYPMNEKTSVTLTKAMSALGEAAESKSLYGLAEAIYALAGARSAVDYVDQLLNPQPTLSPQEAEIVRRIYEETAAMSDTAATLFRAKCEATPEKPPTAEEWGHVIAQVFAGHKSAFDLTGLEIKAGARHSAADMKMIQAMHDNAVALGASCPT